MMLVILPPILWERFRKRPFRLRLCVVCFSSVTSRTVPDTNVVTLDPFLLDHVNVITACCLGLLSGGFTTGRRSIARSSTPVIVHFCIQFLSRFSWSAIDEFVAFPLSVLSLTPLAWTPSSAMTRASAIPLPRNVAIDVLRSRLGHIASPVPRLAPPRRTSRCSIIFHLLHRAFTASTTTS